VRRSPWKIVGDVGRGELPFALLMFAEFFLVVTTFWILKPLKKARFVQFYDQAGLTLGSWQLSAAEAELLAKMANMVVAAAAVVLFTWLARRLRRERLTCALCALFGAGFAAYAVTLATPGSATVWSFYLFGDLFSTLMVPAFFAFLNDSVDADGAKRLYGIVGLGGVTGGVFGSSTLSALVDRIAPAEWMWICLGLAGAIALVAVAAGRVRPATQEPSAEEEPAAADGTNPALAGARLVFRSRYLLAIAVMVGLYEIVSTTMDFQFTSTVAHFLDGDAIAAHLARVFAFTNVLSMAVQLFCTSLVMRTFGVGVALLVLPVAAGTGSLAFLGFPSLWTGSALNTADNAFSYSINQSAKEALYVPTTAAEKYQAKAFIDMFVQRFAKTLAVVISLGFGAWMSSFGAVRWLSLVTAGAIVVWVATARYAGRRFAEADAPSRKISE